MGRMGWSGGSRRGVVMLKEIVTYHYHSLFVKLWANTGLLLVKCNAPDNWLVWLLTQADKSYSRQVGIATQLYGMKS